MLNLLAQEFYFTPQGHAPGFPSLSQGLPSTNLVYLVEFLSHNSEIVIMPLLLVLLFILGFTAMWRTTRKPEPPAPVPPKVHHSDPERTYTVRRGEVVVATIRAVDVSLNTEEGGTFPRLNFIGAEIGKRKDDRATVALIPWEAGLLVDSVPCGLVPLKKDSQCVAEQVL